MFLRALSFIFIAAGVVAAPLSVVAVEAQLDPSAGLLLNNGTRGAKKDSGLDSGRYTVRPKNDSARKDDARATRKTSSPSGPTSSQEDPALVEVPDAPTEAVVTVPSAGQAPSEPAPQPVEVVVGGATEPVAEPLRLDPRRENLLEISIAPAFIYSNSDSSYFFRRYNSASAGVGIDADVWLKPTFALHAEYLGSVGAHVSDSLTGTRNVSATQQWFAAGIRSRRFFGTTAFAPAMTLGLDYHEYQMRVPADAVYRGRLTSTGPMFLLEAELPSSILHAWMLSVAFAPKLTHTEASASTAFQSGSGVDANSLEISVGSRLRFDREHAVFWKLSHSVEKDLFSGTADPSDPLASTKPSGVAVTNSITVLRFGYTWGN